MLSPQLTTPGTRPTPSRPLEDRILELEIGVNISDSEPKTPRQQAMSERLDSYAAERDLYDVVVQGKPAPVKPSSPLRTLRFDPRWSPSPDSVDDSIAVRHAAPPAPFQPDRAARTQSPPGSKVAEEHYGSRSDACPPPLGQREVEALDIASVATAVLTPSRMELMIRWSANVDLLYGLTRAQRASVIKNAEVRVYREDEEIIRQDAVSQELYVVISGRCAIVLPSLEEVWQEKFPSGEQQELRDMTLGPRAKCSRDHWLEHAEKHREELLRLKDLGRGWHQEYMGMLSKRFATKWRVSTKQTREEREGTKNGYTTAHALSCAQLCLLHCMQYRRLSAAFTCFAGPQGVMERARRRETSCSGGGAAAQGTAAMFQGKATSKSRRKRLYAKRCKRSKSPFLTSL